MSRIQLWISCQLVLVAPFWAHIGVSAYFIPLEDYGFLLPRTTGCASGYSACANSNLPSNFCCVSGATCEVLAANTTIVCCPSGQDCDTIYPISCNITQEDADLYPKSGVKTTALNGVLEQCGTSTCCPFGYSCDSSDVCTKNADQSEAPTTTSSVATTTATSTSTSSTSTLTSASTSAATEVTTSSTTQQTTVAEIPTVVVVTTIESTTATTTTAVTNIASASSTTTTAAGAAVTSGSTSSTSGGSKTSSIVGGVVGGLAGLLLIGAAVWFFMGYRLRHRKETKSEMPETSNSKLNRSTSSFGNIINNPLPISSPKLQSCTTFRSDFIRKTPASPPLNTTANTGSRDPPAAANQDSIPVRPIRGVRNLPPQWQRQEPPPPQQRQSESGGEEINVGADPSIIANSGLNAGNYRSSLPKPPPAILDPNHPALQKQSSNERLTTFTTMMKEADLNLERYVADTPHSSPMVGRK